MSIQQILIVGTAVMVTVGVGLSLIMRDKPRHTVTIDIPLVAKTVDYRAFELGQNDLCKRTGFSQYNGKVEDIVPLSEGGARITSAVAFDLLRSGLMKECPEGTKRWTWDGTFQELPAPNELMILAPRTSP